MRKWLTPDELTALKIFAAEYGRTWKAQLRNDWMNARIYRDPQGIEHPVLHRLRNELGPTWLAKFQFPK